MTAISTLSVSSWRTRVERGAPRALRTANSFLRESARKSRRLATLAQAINKTKPTAAERISRVGRTFATRFA